MYKEEYPPKALWIMVYPIDEYAGDPNDFETDNDYDDAWQEAIDKVISEDIYTFKRLFEDDFYRENRYILNFHEWCRTGIIEYADILKFAEHVKIDVSEVVVGAGLDENGSITAYFTIKGKELC